jgi:hypothetical protein
MTEDGAVEWMAKHGRPGYAAKIHELEARINEYIGDAGRYWQDCPVTMGFIKSIRAEIDEIKRAAWDRYDDWASDPL